MKLWARLPKDRMADGSIWAINNESRIEAGPEICRGKADNATATKHGNIARDPLKSHGDHPSGVYRVVAVNRGGGESRQKKYGPAFLALRPVSGDAWTAAQNGRTGLGIHGGRLLEDGRLRPTYGCLRAPDAFVAVLADLVEVELDAGREVFYEAVE